MYTKRRIDIITLIIVSIILILINLFQIINQSNLNKILEQSKIENSVLLSKNQVENNEIETEGVIIEEDIPVDVKKNKQEELEQEIIIAEPVSETIIYPEDWYIIIPKIDLIAPIEQGTSDEILNKSVGHFEESQVWKGNVCLAAHNRGYDVNYFERIKELLINDIIMYQYGNSKKTYAVSNVTIIKETDWSYIESKTENKITLITCVEDEPEYRLCVQATEIK